MNVVIYHNQKCSKSRATLELIKEKGIVPEIINYLENPPNEEQLATILNLLEKKPQEMIRFKEKRAIELTLKKNNDREEKEWIEIMVKNPILIERPIVVINNTKAVVGRPPENVLLILEK